MRFVLIQLRNVVMAFAVLLLGLVVVAAPAGAADSTLPSGYYLCHATGSASSVETVKGWVYNKPSNSGQASGHADLGHQNGLDIVPPIPGLLPNGQNWTVYGQQVHANGCAIPTYVNVAGDLQRPAVHRGQRLPRPVLRGADLHRAQAGRLRARRQQRRRPR